MEQNSMGKRIMALRKERGLTQEQLSEKVGVTAQAVSKWENDVSCPDISILPVLADALGVSTDELLGVRPIEPKVVLVETAGNKEQKRSEGKGFSVTYDGDKKSGVWFGVLVILVGVAFLLTRTNVLPGGSAATFWGIVWPAALLGVGISWFVKDFSPLGLGAGLLGLYYLLFNLGAISYVLSWGIVWPVLIILFGLTILFDKILPQRKKWQGYDGHKTVSDYDETDGFIRYDCAFSEENRKAVCQRLTGADLDISFGKSVLDLTSVQSVQPGARIDADVSFGNLELLLPRTVRLTVRSDKAFGNIEIKGDANPDATDAAELIGDVSFGSMVVRYQ